MGDRLRPINQQEHNDRSLKNGLKVALFEMKMKKMLTDDLSGT